MRGYDEGVNAGLCAGMTKRECVVISPCGAMDSRLRGNDESVKAGRDAGMMSVLLLVLVVVRVWR